MQAGRPGLYLRLTAVLTLAQQPQQQTELEPRTLPGLRHLLLLVLTTEKTFTDSDEPSPSHEQCIAL